MENEKQTEVRASFLDSYPICPRRALAGYLGKRDDRLSVLPANIGAIIGTGVHAMVNGEVDSEGEIEKLVQESQDTEGVQFDDTADNPRTAAIQVRRMAAAFMKVNGEVWKSPTARREFKGSAVVPYRDSRENVESSILFTGHPDFFDDGNLRDIKTSKHKGAGSHLGQMGGYVRMIDEDVKVITIHKVQRVPMTKSQPTPTEYNIDVDAATKHSMLCAVRFASDLRAFEKNFNPETVMANPSQPLCSKSFCPAHGTKFCNLWK